MKGDRVITFGRIERREVITTESVWKGTESQCVQTTRTTITTRYRVSGVAAVSLYSDDRGRRYVPTAVTVQQHLPSEPSVRVLGCLLRKDGSLSENAHTIHRFGWRGDDWPEWLVEIVADATTDPGGETK